MKYLVVTMLDGTRWAISARFIAENRAGYYANLDVERGDEEDFDKAFDVETEYALSDDFELTDWASNNMNWEDISAAALPLPTKQIICDYHKEWPNADKSIVVVEENRLSKLLLG